MSTLYLRHGVELAHLLMNEGGGFVYLFALSNVPKEGRLENDDDLGGLMHAFLIVLSPSALLQCPKKGCTAFSGARVTFHILRRVRKIVGRGCLGE